MKFKKPRKPVVTKKQLQEEIDALRHVGYQLSNIAFNMGQESSHPEVEPRIKAQMRDLQRKWDAIPRSKPILPNPTQTTGEAEIRTVRV